MPSFAPQLAARSCPGFPGSADVLREGVDLASAMGQYNTDINKVKVAGYGLGVVVFLAVAANQHISIALGHIPYPEFAGIRRNNHTRETIVEWHGAPFQVWS